MSKRVKGITITLGADKTGLDRALKEIESVSRNLNKELRDVNSLLKFSPDNTKLVTQKQKLLADQIKATKEKLDQLRQAEEQVQSQFEKGEIKEEQYRAYQREIVETESKLRYYEKALKETGNEQIAFGEKMQAAGEKMKKAGDKMQEVGRNLSMKVTAPILAIGTAGVMAAIDFESGMAGVRKTTDLTAEELDTMGQALRDMAKEIPVSVVELTNLAETAGQLGIEKEHLVDFTRTVADLSVATNILGQEGATDMARFANIMQMSQRDFDRMGSSIVELGNNTATTEKEILNMATRLASSGKQANMTEADVLGIAAGLSALGLEAQAGGTAFSRVINRIQLDVDTGSDDLEGFASIAGMTADQFAKAWEEDAAGALSEFIKGLADTTEHGQSTNEMLEELGIKEIRVSDALRRTSGANELFTKTLKLSNDAWEENNALQQEASIRYETTESKLKIAKNELNDAAIDIGAKLIPAVMTVVEVVTNLVTGFSNLSPKTQDTIVKMALFAAALGPVSSIAGKVSSGIGNVTSGIGKLAEWAAKSESGLGTFITQLGAGSAVGIAGAALAASGYIYLLVKELTAIDPALKRAREAMEEAETASREISDSFVGQTEQIELYKNELFELADTQDKDATQKERMAQVVERLKELVPGLVLEYEKETDRLNMTKDAIEGVIAAEKNRLFEAAKSQMIQTFLEAEGKALGEISAKQAELTQLTQSRGRIEEALNKARQTGLTDEGIKQARAVIQYGQLTEARRKELNLTEEQVEAVRGLSSALSEEEASARRLGIEIKDGWSDAGAVAGEMGKQIGKVSGELDDLNDVYKTGEARHQAQVEGLEKVGAELGIFAQTTKETAKSVEEDHEAMAKAAEDAAAAQAKAQKELEEETEKHKNVMSGFTKERFDYEKGTTKEFIKMWEDELVAFQNYHKNLQTIASKVGPDVAAELEKLGTDAAPLIQKFVDGADEDLARLATIMQERTAAATAQAKLGLDPLKGIGEEGGKDFIDGLVKGMKDNQSRAGTASGNVGGAIERGLKTRLEISSPSKVGAALGQNFAESLGLGITKGEDRAERDAKDLAQTIINATVLPDLKRDNVIDGRTAFAGMTSALTASAVGGDIIIQNMSVRDDNDIRLIARELHNLQQGQKRGRGLA